jgi:biotin operon repressor
MRASRLLSILILLQARGRITAESLAEEFGVSVRTVYRDVDALGAAGIPVQSDRGPGDAAPRRLPHPPDRPAADEAEAMLLMGMPAQAAELGLGPAAVQARGKLMAALPVGLGEGAGRMGARFHLDPVDWYRAAEPVEHLPALARAVLDQRIVTMRYESWTTTRDWLVGRGIVLKAGAGIWWHAAAASCAPSRFPACVRCGFKTRPSSAPTALTSRCTGANRWRVSRPGCAEGRASLRATPTD